MRRFRLILLLGLVALAAIVLALSRDAPGSVAVQRRPEWRCPPTFAPPPPESANDPALFNPTFAAIFRKNGPDWDRDLHPSIRLQVEWQRIIGNHAWITGHGIGNPGFAYDEPRFVISVWEWDHTDLFELGLPRTFEGRPVVITELSIGCSL